MKSRLAIVACIGLLVGCSLALFTYINPNATNLTAQLVAAAGQYNGATYGSGPYGGGVVVDTTAPVLSSPIDLASDERAGNGAVTTNEIGGTLYWVVTESATTPSVVQIKAGEAHTGSSASAAGTQSVNSIGLQSISMAGLTAATDYVTHFTHTDAAGNDATPVSASGFTTDAASGATNVLSRTVLKSGADITNRPHRMRLNNANSNLRELRSRRESEFGDDVGFRYPLGIYEFVAEVDPGSTETVVIELDRIYNTSAWTNFRKYDGTDYNDISDQVEYGTTAGVTTITYDVLDNGPLDLDDRLGFIVDPVGPAIPEAEEEEDDSSGGSSSSGGGGGGGGSSRVDEITITSVTTQSTSASIVGTVSDEARSLYVVVSAEDKVPRCSDKDDDDFITVVDNGAYEEDETFTISVGSLITDTEYFYIVCGRVNGEDESSDRDSFNTRAKAASPITTTNEPTTPVSTPITPSSPINTTIPSNFSFDKNISFIQPSVNDPVDVQFLAQFLNDFEGENLPVDTIHSAADDAAVKRFQTKYKREILDVWGLTDATGYVGITTRLKLNFLLKGQTAQCPVFTEFNGGISPITVSSEIQRTKEILADLDMYNGPIDQVWTPQTHEAMVTFQETFREVMLDPWNITEGTGYKYKTTNKFLNYFAGCDTGAVELEGVGVYEGI